jgi:hypothetical protein
MVLHWEPNYGTADGTLGQWILVPNAPAQPPFTPPVATFCKNRIQDGKKRRATNLKSYGDSSGSGLYVPILDRSLVTRPREAEFNFLQVTTTGEIYAQDSSSQKISATYKNSMSWDEDPAHPTAVEYLADGRPNPDYIGHFRPVWVVDPTLPDRAACDLVARRYWDFAGHGQLWLEFRAPMVTIDDGNPALQGRSRPLRIMDIVAFDELDIAGVTKKNVSGVVRSCNPDSHDDRMSEAEYEVIVYPSGLPDA